MLTSWIIFTGSYILDLIFGDPRRMPHPVQAMGWLIEKAENPLRKRFREKAAGAILTSGLVILVFLVTFFICYFSFKIHKLFGFAVNIFLGYTTISVKSLIEAANDVKRELLRKDPGRARIKLSHIVGRDTNNLSEKDTIRAVVETVAENTTDGIISPLFYLAIGGAPLAMAYKAVNTLDSMIGHKSDKYVNFGYVAATADEVANFIPARITALGILFSSWFSGCNVKEGFKFLLKKIFRSDASNSILTEGAVASVLGVRLGGVNYYKGKQVLMPYLGEEKRLIEIPDINRTTRISFLTGAIFAVLVIFIKII